MGVKRAIIICSIVFLALFAIISPFGGLGAGILVGFAIAHLLFFYLFTLDVMFLMDQKSDAEDRNAASTPRGRLVMVGRAIYGLEPVEVLCCQDCGTEYIRIPGQPLTVNGRVAVLCPWCREDTASWRNGRGI